MNKHIMAGNHAVSVMLIAVLTVLIAFAATFVSRADDGYTYRMRISAGNNGVIVLGDGSETDECVIESDADGTFPSISTDSVKPTNSKYQVIGFREAGRDEVMPEIAAVSAKSDHSYVAVYGVEGGMVSYKVRYLDEEGNSLMDDATYYGPKGSSVTVSFKYIEGYAPTAYNLKKTLSGNSEQDVLDFRYYASNLTVTQQGGAVNAANPAVPVSAGANQAAAQAEIIDAATPGTPAVVDLDENETPLAGPADSSGGFGDRAGGAGPAAIITVTALVIAIAALAFAIAAKRRRQNAEDQTVIE